MKKFLLKCILLAVILVVPIAAVNTIDWALRSRISFELPKDKTVLFIGDSHIETSVNDKLIPKAFNWAKSAENYVNLFVRTKKLLETNPQIDTVFISVTPHFLRKDADRRFSSRNAEGLLQLNLPFYDRDELVEAFPLRTTARILTNVRAFESALRRIVSGRTVPLEELGGFQKVEECGLSKDIEDGGKLFHKRIAPNNPSYDNSLSVKYLRKIVGLIRSKGGRVIFLNPPIYHAEEFFDVPYFENLLKENFPDVEFWDYGNYPIPENCFKDINHLNGKGAEIFSKELARRMKEEGISDDGEWERPTPAN